MINVFIAYSILWISILILYLLNWSNLCLPLDSKLVIFLIFIIISSLIIGIFFKKDLKYYKIKEEPRDKNTIIIILVFLYLLTFLYNKNIPLMLVVRGIAYNSGINNGIPHLNLLLSSASICYCIYLSYIFSCFKRKKTFVKIMIIIAYFALMMQRQNLFICLIFLFYMIILSVRKNKKSGNKFFKNILKIFLVIFFVSYVFGIIGNARYGSKWDWNDSSMILKLGKINNKFPKILPEETVWTYIYAVTPLANLNYNIKYYEVTSDFSLYLKEFFPEYISNKLFTNYREDVNLITKSLNASTGYVRAYRYGGFSGMYLMYFVQMFLSVVLLTISKKTKTINFIPVSLILSYFLLFSFFENMFYYSISSYCIIIAFFMSMKIKLGGKYEKN